MHSSLYISREQDESYQQDYERLVCAKSSPAILTLNASLSPVDNLPKSCSSPHFFVNVSPSDHLLTYDFVECSPNAKTNKSSKKQEDNKSCCTCCCKCFHCCMKCLTGIIEESWWFCAFTR